MADDNVEEYEEEEVVEEEVVEDEEYEEEEVVEEEVEEEEEEVVEEEVVEDSPAEEPEAAEEPEPEPVDTPEPEPEVEAPSPAPVETPEPEPVVVEAPAPSPPPAPRPSVTDDDDDDEEFVNKHEWEKPDWAKKGPALKSTGKADKLKAGNLAKEITHVNKEKDATRDVNFEANPVFLKASEKSDVLKEKGDLAKPVTKIREVIADDDEDDDAKKLAWQKPEWTSKLPKKSILQITF